MLTTHFKVASYFRYLLRLLLLALTEGHLSLSSLALGGAVFGGWAGGTALLDRCQVHSHDGTWLAV